MYGVLVYPQNPQKNFESSTTFVLKIFSLLIFKLSPGISTTRDLLPKSKYIAYVSIQLFWALINTINILVRMDLPGSQAC